MTRTAWIVVSCLLLATQVDAQTEIRLKRAQVGETKVSGFILPPPKEATGYILEIFDVSETPARFLDRRAVPKVDTTTGAFTVDFGNETPLEAETRIDVHHSSGTPAASMTTPRLAAPGLRQTLHDGARVIEGQIFDATGVEAVSVRVTRSTLENTVGPSSFEQIKSTAEISGEGTFTITLPRPLIAGQVVVAQALSAGGRAGSASPPITVTDPGSWGRARAYFAAGVVFSKERGDFSQQDLAMTFAMDKGWLQRADYKLPAEAAVRTARRAAGEKDGAGSGKFTFRQLNTFFDARLTALPVPAGDDGEAGEEKPFVDSRKAAVMQAGIYAPIYGPQTSWVHDGAVNALFIAPLVRGGIQTITTEPEDGAEPDDVFNFYSVGFGIGHHKLSGTTNQTPEVISYLNLSWGRAEAFEREIDGRIVKPLRMFVEGRLKIPDTALQVGFDANLGGGRDDIRFIFGTRFDVGELFERLKGFK